MKLLIFGDIVGKTGRLAFVQALPALRDKYSPDFVIVNGENAVHGKGINLKVYNFLIEAGVDLITMGDHTYSKKEIDLIFADSSSKIIRPANLEPNLPGNGLQILDDKLVVINLQGQVFMNPESDKTTIANPFHFIDKLTKQSEFNNILIIVDFHGEATSEKSAFGWHVDGSVSLVYGTHTHVQTNDARVLPGGTGFITDIGMCGAYNSVIGDDKDTVLPSYTSEKKHMINPADFPAIVSGIYVEIEDKKTTKIETFNEIVEHE